MASSPDAAAKAAMEKSADVPLSKNSTFLKLFSYSTRQDCIAMFFGSIGAIITGVSFPVVNILFGRMIDALNSGSSSFAEGIAEIAIAFVVLGCIQIISSSLGYSLWGFAGESITQNIKLRFIKAILSNEIGWFDTNCASSLSTKVVELTSKLQDGTTKKFAEMIQFSAQFIGSFVVGFYLCWQLSLVLLASFPLIGAAGTLMISAISAAQANSSENYARAGGVASESLNAIRTVTSLNIQPDVISKYRRFLFEAMQIGIKKGRNLGIGNGSVFLAMLLAYSLGFWYGGKLVAEAYDDLCFDSTKCISGGKIISTFFCIVIGSFSLAQAVPSVTAVFEARAACGQLIDVIERKSQIDSMSAEGLTPNTPMTGEITLDNIKFAYPSRPDIEVCKGYSLNIKAHQTVAFVGRSGCGKSTVINLLLRFYDPSSGGVMIDGTDIRKLNIKFLRDKIGYVGQEPVLFPGTIAENIVYGVTNSLVGETKGQLDAAMMEKIVEAAKQSNAHDFISSFPMGYDTDVGSNGAAMSGGQKQRIAIARALIKKPVILLLDEATSALDATSEKLVQESIDKLQQSKSQTTIVIAHRLSTIRNADKIAVISDGVIVECATHDELIAKPGGLYADLVRLQMEGASSGDGIKKVGSKDLLVKALEAEVVEDKVGDVVEKSASDGKAEPAASEKITKDEESALNKHIWSLIMTRPQWVLLMIFGGCGFGCVFPIWGYLLASAFDLFYKPTGAEVITAANEVAVYFLIMGSGAIIFATCLMWGAALVSERVSMRLRSDMFEAVISREITFFDHNAVGGILTRLADDSAVVTKASGELLAKQLQAGFTVCVGFGIGLAACWQVALVVIATFPVNAVAGGIQHMIMTGMFNGKEDVTAEGDIISTTFLNMRTVTAFNMQHVILKDYENITTKLLNSRIKVTAMIGGAFGIANGVIFCTYALLFWYGSTLIESGDTTFLDMMRALFCIMLGTMGMGTAFADAGDQNKGLQAAKRIFRAIDDAKLSAIDGLSTQGDIPNEGDGQLRGRLEFKNVNFSYPTRLDAKVCRDYNLTIEPGQLVALVGPSGSGKSTIVNLLLRFYDPSSGQILLDGVDIRSLNVRWLRSKIGYVGQEPALFQGTVQENILKGLPQYNLVADSFDVELKRLECEAAASVAPAESIKSDKRVSQERDVELGGDLSVDERVVFAARQSYAHDFISEFPQGYDTDVGEGSMMVSGGQKQRIAIARALIKKPAILLLDEATSALDATSEKLVQESIDKLQQSKSQTTIVIAHRLSTIRNADKIVVIDKGSILEIGTHDELLEAGALYSELWLKQNNK